MMHFGADAVDFAAAGRTETARQPGDYAGESSSENDVA